VHQSFPFQGLPKFYKIVILVRKSTIWQPCLECKLKLQLEDGEEKYENESTTLVSPWYFSPRGIRPSFYLESAIGRMLFATF
jgi:hypothetical protein